VGIGRKWELAQVGIGASGNRRKWESAQVGMGRLQPEEGLVGRVLEEIRKHKDAVVLHEGA
jgi:hypothetical protein